MAPPKHKNDDDFPLRLPRAGGKEVKFNKEELKNIANRLEKDLHRLTKHPHKEAVEKLPDQAAVGERYSAGQGLHKTFSAASTQIGGTYKDFIDAYERIIESLRKSRQNLEDADDDARRRARNAY
jgi:uncharacterized protein YukE